MLFRPLRSPAALRLTAHGPYIDYNRNYAWNDNVTWTKGKHAVKLGFSTNYYQKTENNNSGQGIFAFNNAGAPTGTAAYLQSWANFLLGNVSTFTQPSMDVTPDVRAWQSEAYIQDDFRFTPRLTLFYGVRWSATSDSPSMQWRTYGPVLRSCKL